MTEIKRSIQIEAPVQKVFAYASDYLKWQEFFVGVKDVNPITEKTHCSGAKFIYRAQVLGMHMTVGTEFQQFQENEGWVGKSFKGVKHRTQWIFKNSKGHTDFTFIQNYKCPWYLGGRFIDNNFVKPEWIAIVENSLQNLKRIMEEK